MINHFSFEELQQALAANSRGVPPLITGVSTDTRTIQCGDLFVALRGERFDGHAFLAQAVQAGAVAALVADWVDCDVPQLKVPDTRKALGILGRLNRERFDYPLIGVTGSSGKTTVKEMATAILSQGGSTLATKGNLNNEIGVPLTLLRLAPEHRAAVVELGASGPGEIAWTVSLAQPQVTILNNVSGAHLQGFGSLQGVAQAKGEIITGLAADGVAVLNADDAFIDYWLELAGKREARLFSLDERSPAQFRAARLQADSWGRYHFELQTPAGACPVQLPLPGRHNVANALAAAAATAAVGATLAQIRQGLEQVDAIAGRLQFHETVGGAWVIDDSYNANPGSVKAAIDVLAECPGERILVLGEMAELGHEAAAAHADVGAYARSQGIDRMLTVGPMTRHCVQAFGDNAQYYPAQADLIESLWGVARRNTYMLVKGSRSARMERVVAALQVNKENN